MKFKNYLKIRNRNVLNKVKDSKFKIIVGALVVLALAGGFLFLRKPAAAEAGWWDNDWLYRVKITIDVTKISADIANFPVLVKLTSSQLDFTKAQSAGQDIRFTDEFGNTLKYEIEDWSQANSAADVWVKIPAISSARDTYFYMYYGNSAAADAQDKNNVWNNGQIGVWHEGEGTGGTTADSTSGAHTATINNAAWSASGKIGNNLSFDGNTDYVNLGNLVASKSALTYSLWVKNNLSTTASDLRIIRDYPAYISWQTDERIYFYIVNSLSQSAYAISNSAITDQSWHLITGTYDGSTIKLYIDGALQTTTAPLSGDTNSYQEGVQLSQNVNPCWNGFIDDTMIYNRALSQAEITAQYNSGNNTLISFGKTETGTGPSVWLKFDEGYSTTAYDSSGAGYNGTITGAAWVMSGCKLGKCLSFNGTSNYVSVGNAKTIQTVSFWVRPNSVSVTEEPLDLNGSAYVKFASGVVSAPGWTGPTIYINGIANATTISANTWSHIEITAATGISASAVNIGKFSSTYFNGTIDEVKFYTYARTAGQVKMDYDKSATARIGGDESWLTNGLVGYWKMDEASGNPVDSSGVATTLTNVGTTTFSRGHFANAATMDGSTQYFYAADNASLSITGSLTLSAWVYANSVTGSHDILAKWDGTNKSYLLSLEGSDLRMWIGSGSNYKTTSSASLATGTWYLVNATYNSTTGTVRLYINGVENTGTVTGTIPTSIADDASRFQIGAHDSSTTAANYFNGKIDDARVYNRALSSQEVARLYDWGPPPVAQWTMNEGSGANIHDSAGTADGSITGATWKNASACHSGSCLSFDGSGNSYINCGAISANSLFNVFKGPFALSAWANWNGATSSQPGILVAGGWGNYQGIVRDGSWNSYKFAYQLNDGAVNYLIDANVAPVVGRWYYIVATYDGAILKLYVNGVQQSQTWSGSSNWSTDAGKHLVVGNTDASSTNSNYNFPGLIDDVKIYNYALTQKQISALYDSGSVGHSNAPVGYWKFDEGYSATAYDSSGNSKNLTLSAESWTMSGKFGKAWHGDGTKYLSKADDDAFDIATSDDATISTWFKSTSASNPASNEFLINKETTSAGYAIYLNTSGYPVFGIDDDATWTPDDTATASQDFYDGTWHQATAIKHGTTSIDIYVDGVKKQTTTMTASGNLANSASLFLGASGIAAGKFNGDIDETKIYRFALSPEEVLLDYNQGKALREASSSSTVGVNCPPGFTGTCDAPVAEWKMDEGSGTKVYDDTAGTADGTITGATWKNAGSCHSGSCLSFDGASSYVSVGNTSQTGVKTVALWVKPNAVNVTEEPLDLNGSAYVKITNGTVTGEGFTTPTVYINGISGAFAVTTGWNFIAITTATGLNANTLNIGKFSSTYFNGLVDDVKIYNYALTQEQISWLYNKGAPADYWKFDEGQGATTKDSTTNNKTGTITNATWTTSGKFNSALTFNGTSALVSVGNTGQTTVGGVSLWVKPVSITSVTEEPLDLNGAAYVKITNGVVSAPGFTSPTIYVNGVANATAITAGVWNHIEITTATGLSASALNIGKYSTTYFNGSIDEVKIYTYQPNATQMKMDYNGGSALRFGQ